MRGGKGHPAPTPLFDEISARFLAADIDTHHAAGEVIAEAEQILKDGHA